MADIPRNLSAWALTELVRTRSATTDDASQLAELSQVLGYPATPEEISERLRRFAANARNAVFVVELATGEIAGWIHGAEQELLESGRHCEILGLVVSHKYRRLGLGQYLVRALENWAIAKGLENITVRSNAIRKEPHLFYDKIGFTRIKTQHVYRKPLAEK